MLGMNKKKIATIIMARIKPESNVKEDFVQKLGEPGFDKEVPELPKEDENEHTVALETAAEDLLAAIEAKDPKALATALKDVFTICEALPEDYEDEEEEEELEV